MKYKYEYETVRCKFDGWGLGAGNYYNFTEHRDVINSRAENGWRYVGYIPTQQRGTGHVETNDLIFEKEI